MRKFGELSNCILRMLAGVFLFSTGIQAAPWSGTLDTTTSANLIVVGNPGEGIAGPVGGDGILQNVTGLDWHQNGAVWFRGFNLTPASPAGATSDFTVTIQAFAGGVASSSSTPDLRVAAPGAQIGTYEYTFSGIFNATATSQGGGNYVITVQPGGSWTIYFDVNPNAAQVTGQGFKDGVPILSGRFTDGLATYNGVGGATFFGEITSFNDSFVGGPAPTGMQFGSTLNFPGDPVIFTRPNFIDGASTGSDTSSDFIVQADGFQTFILTEQSAIKIVKVTGSQAGFANGVDANNANAGDAPQIAIGNTVYWTYRVTNTGNVALNNVLVADDQGVTVTCPKASLAPGESMDCTASGTAQNLFSSSNTVPGMCGSIPSTPLYKNIGSVVGSPVNGQPNVTANDPSHYCNPQQPSIKIVKVTGSQAGFANGVDANNPNAGDAPQIAIGNTVYWTYRVTNTGNVALNNVSVTDDQGVAVTCPATSLAPGASMDCTASGSAENLLSPVHTTVPGTCGTVPNTPLYKNIGKAVGSPANSQADVTATDPSHYCNPQQPSIKIVKVTGSVAGFGNGVDANDPNAGDAPQIAIGNTVYWTYRVTNTGNVALNNVLVADDQGVTVTCPKASLAPGESMDCTASGMAVDLTSTTFTTVPGMCGTVPQKPLYRNKGTASGQPTVGGVVTADDLSHYCNSTQKPKIDLIKYVSVATDKYGKRIWEDANFPTGPMATVCSASGDKSSGGDDDDKSSGGHKSSGGDDDDKSSGGHKSSGGDDDDKSSGGHKSSGGDDDDKSSGGHKSSGDDDDDKSSGGHKSSGGDDDDKSSGGHKSSGDDDDDKSSGMSCIKHVYFKFVVTNTGDVTLTNLVLTDVTANAADKVDVSSCVLPSSLAVGASFTCVVGPVPARTGQHTDTGKVTAKGGSTTVWDKDDANYYGKGGKTVGTGTPGYWKNHPEAWPVDKITIGGVLYTKSQALKWLGTPDGGDKTVTMFRHLVSAKLNVLNGTDSSCIASTISAADAWMKKYGPVGSGVGGSSAAWQQGSPLATALDNYNNGLMCAPHRD